MSKKSDTELKRYRHKDGGFSIEVRQVGELHEQIETRNGVANIAPNNYIATVIEDESTENMQELGDVFGLTQADLDFWYTPIK